MPANASFDKGAAVEEWTDQRFFRPIGLRIARACMPTSITPDQITGVALVTGLIAGNLLFYRSVTLNAIGVAMFVVSDIFDSADGQLARMRGTSTRLGKILDGISDGSRFANLYITLIARLVVSGTAWWLAVPLGVAAGLAHARQSGAVDYIRQLYLYLAEGGSGEFNLPEDPDMNTPGSRWHRAQLAFYRNYLAGNGRMLPRSTELVRALRHDNRMPLIAQRWAQLQSSIVEQCAWIGQNIRFALLAIFVVPGRPDLFLWVTLLPMSAILVSIVVAHERRAASLLDRGAPRLAEAA